MLFFLFPKIFYNIFRYSDEDDYSTVGSLIIGDVVIGGGSLVIGLLLSTGGWGLSHNKLGFFSRQYLSLLLEINIEVHKNF